MEADLRKTEAAVERYLLAFENGRLTDASCETRVRAFSQRLADLCARRDQLRRRSADDRRGAVDDDIAWLRAHVHDVTTSGDMAQR